MLSNLTSLEKDTLQHGVAKISKMQGSFKRIRAGLDDTGQPPPYTHQVLDITGEVQSSSDMDILLMPVTVGDEQSSTCIIQMEKLDKLFEGETNVTDSPVDEKSAGSDSKAFVQQCIFNETHVLVDEQSAGAGTNLGNPVDEQSAGITHVSGNPVDGQSTGLTEEQQSSDAETLAREKVEGLDEDTLKKRFTNTMDAILDQDDIDLGHIIDTGCAMPIRQFMRGMSLGIPVEELDVATYFPLKTRKKVLMG